MSTGKRLREERRRLGYSQADFAEVAGVSRAAQIKYEKGERHPDARYLAAIAEAGADVLYILTGDRSLDKERLVLAIEAVEEALSETNKVMDARHKAELVLAAAELLSADSSTEKDKVVRLVRVA